MRFKHVKLREWGPFQGTNTIVFNGTLIGILGHNGSGKSTVIEAMYSALTGHFRKYPNLADYVRDLPGGGKARSGSIEVCFEHGSMEVTIRRTIAVSSTKAGLKGTQSATLKIRQGGRTEWLEKTGVKMVDQAIRELLGDDVAVMGQYAFVEQSETAAIVESDDSTRTKALHKLFGLDRFEKLWTMLGQEVATIPQVQTVDDVQALNRERGEVQAECARLNSQKGDLQRQLELLGAEVAQADIGRWEQSQDLQTKITAASTTARATSGYWMTQRQQEASAQVEVDRIKRELDKVASLATEAEEFLKNAQAAQQALADKARLERKAGELAARLRGHAVAQPKLPEASWTDEEEQELVQLNAKFVASANFISEHSALVAGGVAAANCPTCKQPIPDLASAISDHQKVTIALQPEVALRQSCKQQRNADQQNYASAKVRHEATLASLQQQAIEFKTEYEDLKERLPARLGMYDAAELAKRRAVIAESDGLSGALTTANASLLNWQNQVSTAKAELDDATESCNALQRQLDGLGIDPRTFTPEHIEQCRETVKESSAKREEFVRVEEQHRAAVQSLQSLESRALRAQELADQAERANMARQTLTDARDLFHREKLPSVLARRYLQAVDVALATFLDLMQSDFTAGLEQDEGNYCFRCVFSDSSERLASNLSGGQKVRFAISFLMAVNEVLASKLGVLALDEPTDQLDDENVQHLAEVLTHVQQFAHSAGVQVFVVTHDRQLAGSFDQTVCLVDGKQVA